MHSYIEAIRCCCCCCCCSPGGAVWSNDPRGLYLAVNGNCSVYRLDVRSGEVSLVLSDTYAKRPYEYEMEGITFWDLRKTGGQDLGERER